MKMTYKNFINKKINTVIVALWCDDVPVEAIEAYAQDGKLVIEFPVMGARLGTRVMDFPDRTPVEEIVDAVWEQMDWDFWFHCGS